MTDNIIEIVRSPVNPDCVRVLEEMLERARAGEITRVGIVADRVGGEWQTVFSKSDDNRIDAAMLIELAIRRLGFVLRGENV